MKLVTVMVILGTFFFSVRYLATKWRKALYAMSLIWPANIFYMTGVNQQTLFCIISIFIITSVIESKKIVPYLIRK